MNVVDKFCEYNLNNAHIVFGLVLVLHIVNVLAEINSCRKVILFYCHWTAHIVFIVLFGS